MHTNQPLTLKLAESKLQAKLTRSSPERLRGAMDDHAASIVVVHTIDWAKPQPPQTFKPVSSLAWVEEQRYQHPLISP
jgi:hypothetical protein